MRTRWGLWGLVVVVAACGSSAAATHASKARCGPRTAQTLAASPVARVYAVNTVVYGCSSQTGRRTRLGQTGSCIRSQRVSQVAVVGELAGYGVESCGVDTGFGRVVVRRLSDGSELVNDAANSLPLGPESYRSVGSLVLKADGAVGWIAVGTSMLQHTKDTEVHKANQGTEVILDTGRDIDPHSLRLRGSTLTWRHGRARRSATLH